MGIEENKEVVRKYYEIINSRDYSRLHEVMHEDFSGRPGQKTLNGIEDRKKDQEYQVACFPDTHNELKEMIAEDEKVVVFTTMTATHTGADFMGHPATGKRAEFDGLAVYTLRDGKLIKGRVILDQLKGFQQLGFYPPMPENK